MVFSRAERVFNHEHFFESKSFAVVHKAYSNEYPDSKFQIQRQVTIFRDTGSVCDRDDIWRRTVLPFLTIDNFEEILKTN
jgi:hypothetical protein